jgi:hypothetical protein
MQNTFLLYIDILGFGNLCEDIDDKVQKIYGEVLALRKRGQQTYSVTIFSDTILVRNLGHLDYRSEVQFLVEFYRELQKSMARLDVFLRAIMTFGYFHEERSDDVYLAYGPAVVAAYKAEKSTKCVGLFLDSSCAEHNKYYPHLLIREPDDENSALYFVYTLASLERLKNASAYGVYIPEEVLTQTDHYMDVPDDFAFLRRIHSSAANLPSAPAREKHEAYLHFYKQRYPELLTALEKDHFSPSVVNNEYDWGPESGADEN